MSRALLSRLLGVWIFRKPTWHTMMEKNTKEISSIIVKQGIIFVLVQVLDPIHY